MALPGLHTDSNSPAETPARPVRRNNRFFPDLDSLRAQFCDVHGRTVRGELVNESYSGIAVLVIDAAGLEVGQEAAVDYYGYPVPGVIRRVIEQPAGDWLIGIEWK